MNQMSFQIRSQTRPSRVRPCTATRAKLVIMLVGAVLLQGCSHSSGNYPTEEEVATLLGKAIDHEFPEDPEPLKIQVSNLDCTRHANREEDVEEFARYHCSFHAKLTNPKTGETEERDLGHVFGSDMQGGLMTY